MNILYLNNSMHLGGDNKCILKLCKELKNENKIIVASHGGQLESQLDDLEIKHYTIENITSKSFFNLIKNIQILIKIIKKEDIEIIHSHHRMTTLVAKIASLFTSVKVIHTQHLCIEDKFKFTHFVLKNIKIITVSEAAKRILIEKSNLNENDIITIYNTIELESKKGEIDSKLIELKKNGYFIVAQISRVIHYKGIYDFIDIAEIMKTKNEKIRFVFIGDGPEFENMKLIINERNLNKYIFLLGRKDNIIEYLKYIDLFILCSYIEGLPLSPLEAFSQGIPVIATNIDGTNEEIINEYNGYLVAPKDVSEFSNKIEYLYENKEKYMKMKENALSFFEKNFNNEDYINKHITVYNDILKLS